MVESRRGAWDDAAAWTPVWISVGPSWRTGDEPLPWSAHETLWQLLAAHAECTRYAKRLGGVPKLSLPPEQPAPWNTF
jgi:hypothetical protein